MGVAQSVPVMSDADRILSQIGSTVEDIAIQEGAAISDFATDAYNDVIVPITEITPEVISETGRILSEIGSTAESMIKNDAVLVANIATAPIRAVLSPLVELPNIICDAFRILMSTATLPIEDLSCYLNHATTLDEPGDDIRANIVEYINNSQEDSHGFGIQVKKLIHIERKVNDDFLRFAHQGKTRMLLWHGTTVNNLCSILRNGLELPPSDKTSLLQGRAIYFADRVSKSAQYCHERRRPSPGDDGVLLLCDVIVGRTHIPETPNHGWTSPPSGFDSVTCPGRRAPSPSQYKHIDGVILPSGSSTDNQLYSNFLVDFNEYAIYNKDQVDVKYVIEFTFTPNTYYNYN